MATNGIQPSGGVAPNATTNAIANPLLAAGCDNLWYAPRCNPRLDPFAMNAVIAEMINLVNCGGNAYDCSRLDNLCTAVKDLIHDVIHDCQRPFGTSSGSCKIERLVLTTDAAGCQKITRYSQTDATIGKSTTVNLRGQNAPQVLLPANPGNPATFYTQNQLAIDQTNGTIDETKLTPNRVATGTINVACTGQIELQIENNDVFFNPGTNGGNGAASQLIPRIDGQFIVIAPGIPLCWTPFTNYVTAQSGSSIFRTLSAGAHTIDVYVIAESPALPPAQVQNFTVGAISSQSILGLVPVL